MNELNKRIEEVVWAYEIDEIKSQLDCAAAILNLPSGLVAESICVACYGKIRSCADCNGTGTVTRDIPLSEVLEFAKQCADRMNTTGVFLFKGERVRAK